VKLHDGSLCHNISIEILVNISEPNLHILSKYLMHEIQSVHSGLYGMILSLFVI